MKETFIPPISLQLRTVTPRFRTQFCDVASQNSLILYSNNLISSEIHPHKIQVVFERQETWNDCHL